ncbi:MAG: hypothetical protein ACI9KN_000394 [Gammaproteobacteria bacterium]|jgi:hypothetical protein
MVPYVGDWDELTLYLEQSQKARATLSPRLIRLWDSITASGTDDPAITLASGADDSFNRQHRWLAGLIGNNHFVTEAGGHKWKVWKSLWPKALRLSGLCDVI